MSQLFLTEIKISASISCIKHVCKFCFSKFLRHMSTEFGLLLLVLCFTMQLVQS